METQDKYLCYSCLHCINTSEGQCCGMNKEMMVRNTFITACNEYSQRSKVCKTCKYSILLNNDNEYFCDYLKITLAGKSTEDECRDYEPKEQNTQQEQAWRSRNVGASDYSKHTIQPWDIWSEYRLNPWEADIIKRILRKKGDTPVETHREDLEKCKHILEYLLSNFDKIYVAN